MLNINHTFSQAGDMMIYNGDELVTIIRVDDPNESGDITIKYIFDQLKDTPQDVQRYVLNQLGIHSIGYKEKESVTVEEVERVAVSC